MLRNVLVIALFAVMVNSAPARAADVEDARFREFVFFSTLQGLYETGLPDDVVDRILTRDPKSGLPVSFIEGCPVCQPVLDAFTLYRSRPAMWQDKQRDFNTAVSADVLAALSQEDAVKRTRAVGALVREIMTRKVTEARWTDAERGAWQAKFEAAARTGEACLRRLQAQGVQVYEMMWSCMVCDGASEGCQKPR